MRVMAEPFGERLALFDGGFERLENFFEGTFGLLEKDVNRFVNRNARLEEHGEVFGEQHLFGVREPDVQAHHQRNLRFRLLCRD